MKEELKTYENIDLGVTGQVVKASEGQLYGGLCSNNQASNARYLKFYDKATAPTEADTPKFRIRLPANQVTSFSLPGGIRFANGISVRASTGVANADTGATTTNDVVVALFYY